MYLTRNQAGVNSASGVRIPPSPPDTQKPPQGGFCVSGGEGGSDSTLRFDSEARSAGERPAKGRAIPPAGCHARPHRLEGVFAYLAERGDLIQPSGSTRRRAAAESARPKAGPPPRAGPSASPHRTTAARSSLT